MPGDEFHLHARIGGRSPGGTPAGDDEDDDELGGVDFWRIAKFLLNVVLKTALLLLFHVLGWLKLAPVVGGWGFGGVVLTAVVLAVVCTLLVLVGLALFAISYILTCGLAIVLVPFVGYFLMKGLLTVSPQFVSAPNDHWFALLLLGTALLLVTVPLKRLRKPVPQTHQGHRVIDAE